MPEHIEYDTTYFFAGRMNYYKTSPKDSMVVVKKTNPSYNFIIVEYDAQNAYGAMIRSQYHLLLVDGKCVLEIPETKEIVCKKKLN